MNISSTLKAKRGTVVTISYQFITFVKIELREVHCDELEVSELTRKLRASVSF